MKYFLHILLLISYCSFSQSSGKLFNATFSPELSKSNKQPVQRIITLEDDRMLFMKYEFDHEDKTIIELRDANFKLLNSELASSITGNQEFIFEDIIKFNNIYYVAYSQIQDDALTNELFIKPWSAKTLKTHGEPIKLSEINFKGYEKENAGSFIVAASEIGDSLVVYCEKPFDSEKGFQFEEIVFDSLFNVLPPLEDEWLGKFMEKYQTTNLIGFVNSSSRPGSYYYCQIMDEELNAYYSISLENSEYKEIARVNLKSDTKRFGNVELDTLPNGNIISTGLYSNSLKPQINGVFTMVFDPLTLTKINENFKEVAPEYFEFGTLDINLYPNREVKRKKEERITYKQNFNIKTTWIDCESGAYIIFEQKQDRLDKLVGGTDFPESVHSYDFIIIKLDNDGDVKWTKRVRKRQRDNPLYTPFFSINTKLINDQLIVIYNNLRGNLELPDEEMNKVALSSNKDLVLIALQFSSNGDVKQQILEHTYSEPVQFEVQRSFTTAWINDTTFITTGRNHRSQSSYAVKLDFYAK